VPTGDGGFFAPTAGATGKPGSVFTMMISTTLPVIVELFFVMLLLTTTLTGTDIRDRGRRGDDERRDAEQDRERCSEQLRAVTSNPAQHLQPPR
jgi:hypothetical protein